MKTQENAREIYRSKWTDKTVHIANQLHVGAEFDNRGFTVVEVLIVAVIIGLLTALAIPAFSQYKNMAKVSRATSELRAIASQIALYQTDHNSIPPQLSDLPGGSAIKDPWGNSYVYYIIPSDGTGSYKDPGGVAFNTEYDLYSTGANRLTTKSLLDPLSTNTSRDDIVVGINGAIVELGERY